VWEKLSHVTGDTSYHTGAFEPFVAPEPAPPPPPLSNDAALGALTDAAAAASVSPEEAAILRQLQEEEDMRTAQLLSQQMSGNAQGSARGAGAAAAGADGGVEVTSGGGGGGGMRDNADAGGDGEMVARELFAAVEAGDVDRAAVALACEQDINARDFLVRNLSAESSYSAA
jgi:hypothetical protein